MASLKKIKLTSGLMCLLLSGAITVQFAKAQTEVFVFQNENTSIQLVHNPAHQTAGLSWNLSGKTGFALLQTGETTESALTFSGSDGQLVAQARRLDNTLDFSLFYESAPLQFTLRKKPFNFDERWQMVKAEGSFRHPNDKGTGAIIELNYLFSKDADDPLNAQLAAFYGLDTRATELEAMMQADVATFVDRYRQASTTAEGNTLDINWMKAANSFPVFVSEALMCIAKTSVVSTGNQMVRRHNEFAIVDTRNRQVLAYDDIFLPDSREALAELLSTALRKMAGLEAGSDLRQAGFFVEKVLPNTNLIAGAGTLGFAYNLYELGPPSKGQPVIMLPLDAVKTLLQARFHALIMSP
ncbi:MAG: DUF3298 domain-containing protein [Bacteroidetes bacterium]|nr:DUF3298 domain-containing protein [Bacteroidota bacterium]